jgi:hypothetical protein
MRPGTGLLPRSLSDSPIPARVWLALAAGAGCSVCAYAGLYPRFDEGSLRLVIALTSAPFAAAVVAYALSARSAARAFGKTVLVAALLGIASTLIPGAILTRNHPSEFVLVCFFGAFFGAGTGVVYGIPLAVLSALGHRHLHSETHEGTDRAARIAGAWLVVLAVIAITGTCVFDQSKMDWDTNTSIPASRAPALAGCAAAITGALAMVVATLRLRRRKAWLDRVRSGLEPRFRIRPADHRDVVVGLPRLGNGITVVEHLLEEPSASTAASAYRVAATGTAVAIVDDDMCTMSSFTVAPAAMSASATSG